MGPDVNDPNPANNTATDSDRSGAGNNIDLTAYIDDFNTYVRGGSLLDFVILVSNNGPSDAVNAKVSYSPPSNFIDPVWTCVSSGAATCTANGNGDIDDTVNIPANGSLLYHLSGTVLRLPEMPLVQTVKVTATAPQTDTDPQDNSSTDTDTVGIFANGFDSARLGTGVMAMATDFDSSADSLTIPAERVEELAATDEPMPVLIAEVTDTHSSRAIDVHALVSNGVIQVRLSVRDASGVWKVGSWHTITPNTALHLGWISDVKDDRNVSIELDDDSNPVTSDKL